MFAVKICIYTDGDFGFDDPEFEPEHDEEYMFYFDNREAAAKALVRSFNNLHCSYRSSKYWLHIKEWINSFVPKMELLAKKTYTFIVYEDLGNQHIEYGLYEVEKKTLKNGSFYYQKAEPLINIGFLYEENAYDWDYISKLPDLY